MILQESLETLQPIAIFNTLDTATKKKQFANAALELLRLGGVDIGHGSQDVKKEDIDELREIAHQEVFALSRMGYTALHCFPGIMEFSVQQSLIRLLSNPRPNNYPSTFHAYETQMLWYMLQQLTVTQALRMFNTLAGRDKKHSPVNIGERARRLCFWYFLNPPEKNPAGKPVSIELWAVKYRSKLHSIFHHFWGRKIAGAISAIFRKKRWSEADKSLLAEHIDKYLFDLTKRDQMYQCVAFALSERSPVGSYGKGYTLKLCVQHTAANNDLDLARDLPTEVLKGKWGMYHKDSVQHAEFFKKAEKGMTQKGKFRSQQAAKRQGVAIKAKASARTMKELWVYALEHEMTQEMEFSLRKKAGKVAEQLPFTYNKIGILVDDSFTSSGTLEQKNHPMASILSMRDVLAMACDENYVVRSVSGRDYKMPAYHSPIGDTDLATPFVQLLREKPDAIFVLSDGHDNVPSGRFQEVFDIARDLGCHLPVYQCNPTVSVALKTGRLSKSIPVLPVTVPEKFGVSLFTALMDADPLKGLERFVEQAIDKYSATMQAFQKSFDGRAITS